MFTSTGNEKINVSLLSTANSIPIGQLKSLLAPYVLDRGLSKPTVTNLLIAAGYGGGGGASVLTCTPP